MYQNYPLALRQVEGQQWTITRGSYVHISQNIDGSRQNDSQGC